MAPKDLSINGALVGGLIGLQPSPQGRTLVEYDFTAGLEEELAEEQRGEQGHRCLALPARRRAARAGGRGPASAR